MPLLIWFFFRSHHLVPYLIHIAFSFRCLSRLDCSFLSFLPWSYVHRHQLNGVVPQAATDISSLFWRLLKQKIYALLCFFFWDSNRTTFSMLRHRNNGLPSFIVSYGIRIATFNCLLLHLKFVSNKSWSYLKFSLRLRKLIIRQIYVVVYRRHMKNYKIQ